MKFFLLPSLSFALLAAVALPTVLSGCAADDDVTVIDNPPPAAEAEVIPLINDPQTEIWCPGYWAVSADGTYTWVPGKVIPRPSPTAAWTPAHWVQHMFGWTFEDGHWE